MAKILIVDDNEDMVELIQLILEKEGHTIRSAVNGAEGLIALNHGSLPDCILLDVDMPIMNGPSMAHQLIIHDAGQEFIPIILSSGRADLEKIANRICTPYFLSKCVSSYSQQLKAMLAKALEERKIPHPPTYN